jgi:hypothetical protein
MVEKVFLTDSRRDVLEGTDGLEKQSRINSKSRIRKRARLALQELVEVANSPEIDNSTVFDPQQVHLLVDALFRNGEQRLTPLWDYDGDPAEYNDEFAYQKTLHSSLSQSMTMYATAMTTEQEPQGMWGALFAPETGGDR